MSLGRVREIWPNEFFYAFRDVWQRNLSAIGQGLPLKLGKSLIHF
jgi:hypothetical protein